KRLSATECNNTNLFLIGRKQGSWQTPFVDFLVERFVGSEEGLRLVFLMAQVFSAKLDL
ncbi:MAG: hypothetical protein ACI81T_001815, partial [Bacteroidia bacterium]